MRGLRTDHWVVVATVVIVAIAVSGVVTIDLTDPDVKAEETVGHILTIVTPTLVVLLALLRIGNNRNGGNQ